VIEILEYSEGRIFLNMVSQLCKFQEDARKFTVAVPDFSPEGDYSTRCFTDKDGQLWAISYNNIRCYETQNLKLLFSNQLNFYTYYSFYAKFQAKNGEIWLVSLNRLTIFDIAIVHYLNPLLSPEYKVINRFDTNSAFKAIEEEMPDLIISDVVMPYMSGYEFCHTIKDDLQLCHLPVILVTAKTTVESQVEGLKSGADAYVTKPFAPNYLLALVKSQLTNREKNGK
jgi:CheY-like chemotaxis protein